MEINYACYCNTCESVRTYKTSLEPSLVTEELQCKHCNNLFVVTNTEWKKIPIPNKDAIPFCILNRMRDEYIREKYIDPKTIDPQMSKKRDIAEREEFYKFYNQTVEEVEQEHIYNAPKKPKCPTCSSTRIKSISFGDRATSVLALGLFSKKINKTFQCLNCKYTW